jgi:hypothetical protein
MRTTATDHGSAAPSGTNRHAKKIATSNPIEFEIVTPSLTPPPDTT